jgi:alanyl-tRNA synthetase
VKASGQIGMFKFISESAVAAGVRRVEAIVADRAEDYFKSQGEQLQRIGGLLKNPKDPAKSVQALLDEKAALEERLQGMLNQKAQQVKNELLHKVRAHNGMNVVAEKIELNSADAIKNISFELKNQVANLFCLLGAEIEGKPQLSLIISENLVSEKKLNASQIIRDLAKEIQGGGGGQAFYANAGGKKPEGLDAALEKGKALIATL